MAGQTSVTPLLLSNIAWTEYLKDTAALTGHTPTRGIDVSGLKLSDYTRFIASLGEFQSGKEEVPLDTIRNNNHFLRHLFFGFLISGSTAMIFRIMEFTDLDVLTARQSEKGRIAVVTGTLEKWKNAIITCLNQKFIRNYELRWVFNQCFYCFRQLGLENIWDIYRRKGLEDQTFLLEYKE